MVTQSLATQKKLFLDSVTKYFYLWQIFILFVFFIAHKTQQLSTAWSQMFF